MEKEGVRRSENAEQSRGEPPRIIAHRGGVTEEYSENSRGALAAAIRRGYWMIETDLRESRDRVIVVHHDPTLSRIGRGDLAVASLDWAELTEAYSRAGSEPPMRFAELCDQAAGRIELMLDFKPGARSDDFLERVDGTLKRYGFSEQTMVIGTDEAKRYFLGALPCAITAEELRADAGEGTAEEAAEEAAEGAAEERRFLFEHGRDLDADTVAYAQRRGVRVVPSINKGHYRDLEGDSAAYDDVARMLAAGVADFQVDSRYVGAVRGAARFEHGATAS
jgi:hypothetical protein